jgi:hypothetical protein
MPAVTRSQDIFDTYISFLRSCLLRRVLMDPARVGVDGVGEPMELENAAGGAVGRRELGGKLSVVNRDRLNRAQQRDVETAAGAGESPAHGPNSADRGPTRCHGRGRDRLCPGIGKADPHRARLQIDDAGGGAHEPMGHPMRFISLQVFNLAAAGRGLRH